ncbi:MAG TPA: hypothetical protein VNN80_18255, partial [Polyangiaceae bacterium]|nr:hypothetical protein [Polyangiaceae bacterium]
AAAKAPETKLRVSSTPIDTLRSPYFAALELSFENPSGEWHEVRRVTIGPERQLFGPALEAPVGARLRAWQLATREVWQADDKRKKDPPPVALETLAPDEPSKAEGGGAVAAGGAPPEHLLAGPFFIAPGLVTRKWVVLYCSAPDGLLGQDLVVAYELENADVERALVKYPAPTASKQ